MRRRRCSVNAAAFNAGGDHGGTQAFHPGGAGGAVAQEERAVCHTGDGIQLCVQIAERTALAGDVDQVGRTAVQKEFLLPGNLDDILHLRQLFDVAAVREHPAVRDFQANAGPEPPGGRLGRAPDGDLAGFRGAIDFQQGGVKFRLDLARQFLAQRSGGRDDEIHRRQVDTRCQQGAQVNRSGHQDARPGHRGERALQYPPDKRAVRRRRHCRSAGQAARWTRIHTCAAQAPCRSGRATCRPTSPGAGRRRARSAPAGPRSFCRAAACRSSPR